MAGLCFDNCGAVGAVILTFIHIGVMCCCVCGAVACIRFKDNPLRPVQRLAASLTLAIPSFALSGWSVWLIRDRDDLVWVAILNFLCGFLILAAAVTAHLTRPRPDSVMPDDGTDEPNSALQFTSAPTHIQVTCSVCQTSLLFPLGSSVVICSQCHTQLQVGSAAEPIVTQPVL